MTKIVARRDSATTILRKLGVKPRDYDLFITVVPGHNGTPNQFEVKVEAAKAHLAKLQTPAAPASSDEDAVPKIEGKDAEDAPAGPFKGLGQRPERPAPAPVKKAPKVKTPKAPKVEEAKAVPAKKEPRVTMSSIARALILEGKTNAEVWAIIQPQFNLDSKKSYYPGWWRFELRRKGHKGI